MTTTLPIRTGDRVRGNYYGAEFTGHVEHARSHTIRWDVEVFHVTLDRPIQVHGRTRDAVAMHLTRTGDPADGFSQPPSHLRVIPDPLPADRHQQEA